MRFGLTEQDLEYGGLTVGAFVIVAIVGYPLAIRNRHSDLLRDALPTRCIAMHFAGCCFVVHDWINWHNASSACMVLAVLEVVASTAFFCTLLWKHHMFYVRHVADRADHRFTLTAALGAVAFVVIGVIRFFYDLFGHECLKLDAAVAGVGLVQLLAGLFLFHRVGRFPGATSMLHFAIRFELGVAFVAVITGFIKQWAVNSRNSDNTNDDITIALLAVMSILFNASFILFLAPFIPCMRTRSNDSFDSSLLNDVSGMPPSFAESSGRGSNNSARGNHSGEQSRSGTNRIADHFQGRLERVIQRLVRKFRDGRSERTILAELERTLTTTHLPAKLLVNAKEEGTERTILHYAAAVGFRDLVLRLMEYSGTNSLEQSADAEGLEPIHCVAIGHEAVGMSAPTRTLSAEDVAAMCAARADIVHALLRSGARVNTPSPDGRRALHYAVQHSAGLSNLANLVSPQGATTPLPTAMDVSSTTATPRAANASSSPNPPPHGSGGDPTLPVHLKVVEALLQANAKQEIAVPINPFNAQDLSAGLLVTHSSAGLGGGFGEDRHDVEWHHIVHRGHALRKTPLMLAVEADDPVLVLVLLRHIVRMNPALSCSPAHCSASGVTGVGRRAGLTCAECGSATILTVALANGSRRVCELLLTPLDFSHYGRRLPRTDVHLISNLVWPMLGARVETPNGFNVMHAAALSGDPSLVSLVLQALSGMSLSMTPPTSPAQRRAPSQSWPATPRTNNNHTNASATPGGANAATATPVTMQGGGGPQFPGESATGSILIVPNPPDAPAYVDNEARLRAFLESPPWQKLRASDWNAFAVGTSRMFHMTAAGGASSSAGFRTISGGSANSGAPSPTSQTVPALPVAAAAMSASSGGGGQQHANSYGAAAIQARKEAAIKILKHAGFASADRLGRALDSRHVDLDDVAALVEVVRMDSLRKLKGDETRIHPTRAQVDSIIGATNTLLQIQFAKAGPVSPRSTGPSFRNAMGNGRPRRGSQEPAGGRRPPSASAGAPPPTPGSVVSVATNGPSGTNLWLALNKLLEARAHEFGAAYTDAARPVTPTELAAIRGHVEACRALCAVSRLVHLQIAATFGSSSGLVNAAVSPVGGPPGVFLLTSPMGGDGARSQFSAATPPSRHTSPPTAALEGGTRQLSNATHPDSSPHLLPRREPSLVNNYSHVTAYTADQDMTEVNSTASMLATCDMSSRFVQEVPLLRACVSEANALALEIHRHLTKRAPTSADVFGPLLPPPMQRQNSGNNGTASRSPMVMPAGRLDAPSVRVSGPHGSLMFSESSLYTESSNTTSASGIQRENSLRLTTPVDGPRGEARASAGWDQPRAEARSAASTAQPTSTPPQSSSQQSGTKVGSEPRSTSDEPPVRPLIPHWLAPHQHPDRSPGGFSGGGRTRAASGIEPPSPGRSTIAAARSHDAIDDDGTVSNGDDHAHAGNGGGFFSSRTVLSRQSTAQPPGSSRTIGGGSVSSPPRGPSFEVDDEDSCPAPIQHNETMPNLAHATSLTSPPYRPPRSASSSEHLTGSINA